MKIRKTGPVKSCRPNSDSISTAAKRAAAAAAVHRAAVQLRPRQITVYCAEMFGGMVLLESAHCVGVGSELGADTEGQIRLILSVGEPHESTKRPIIIVT